MEASPQPAVSKIVPCRACGQPIGLVRLPQGQWRAIQVDPRPYGAFVLLADGVRAIPLGAAWVRGELDSYDGPRFVAHYDVCDARGLRLAGWAAGQVAAGVDTTNSRREHIRAAKLAADRVKDVPKLRSRRLSP